MDISGRDGGAAVSRRAGEGGDVVASELQVGGQSRRHQDLSSPGF
jgi:hypothetical protein